MRFQILLLIKVTTGRETPPGLYYSIMRVHCPPRLHLEPLKQLLNFDLNADTDPAFRSNTVRVLLSKIMRIRIRSPACNCNHYDTVLLYLPIPSFHILSH
jgi:hypothetical protein